MKEKIAKLEKKVEAAEAEARKKSDKIADLDRQITEAKVKLKRKSDELAEETASAKVDGALLVRHFSIQQFSNSTPMFKWLLHQKGLFPLLLYVRPCFIMFFECYAQIVILYIH